MNLWRVSNLADPWGRFLRSNVFRDRKNCPRVSGKFETRRICRSKLLLLKEIPRSKLRGYYNIPYNISSVKLIIKNWSCQQSYKFITTSHMF